MRRLLLFALVFALGLALLLWFEGWRPLEEAPWSVIERGGDAAAGRHERPPPVEPPRGEAPAVGDGGDGAQGAGTRREPELILGGSVTIRPFDESGRARYELRTPDLEHLGGGRYRARRVRIEFFDPEDGHVTRLLEAREAFLTLRLVEGRASVGDGGRVRLTDVTITQLAGSPFAPLVFRVPEAEGDVDDQSFRSVGDAESIVEGQGLLARGQDLVIEGPAGRFTIERGGDVQFESERAGLVQFESTGSGRVVLERVAPEEAVPAAGADENAPAPEEPPRAPDEPEDDDAPGEAARGGPRAEPWQEESQPPEDLPQEGAPDPGDQERAQEPEEYELRLEDGARIRANRAFDGRAVVIEAETVRGLGRQDAAGRFHPRLVLAEGDVVVRSGDDRFVGQRARLEFDAEGRLRAGLLEGSPRAFLHVAGEEPEEEDAAPELIPLSLRGPGPLRIELAEETAFRLEGSGAGRPGGPALLEAPTLGVLVRAQGSLAGRVDAERELARFLAEERVRLTHARGTVDTEHLEVEVRGGEVERLLATSRGRTYVESAAGAQQPLELWSQGELVLESEGAEGEEALWRIVRADNVRVEAKGEAPWSARARRLEDYRLDARTFVASGQVTYVTELGEASAVRVRSFGEEHVELWGLPDQPARFQLAPDEDSGIELASFTARQIDLFEQHLVAEGDVDLRMQTADRQYRVRAARARLELAPEDEGVTRPFVLRAERVGEARVRDADSAMSFRSEQLVVTGEIRPAAAEPVEGERVDASEILATGKVEVHHSARAELSGAGERLLLDGQGRGALSTGPGQRVTTWGSLDAGGLPYEMTADRVEFEQDWLEARQPMIVVHAVVLPVVAPGEPAVGFTEATARMLRADRQGIALSGEARLEGIDRSGRKLVVLADSIELAGDVERAAESEGGEQALRSLEAWGGFTANYEDRASASGETFSFSRDRAVITGRPAELGFGIYHCRSDFIDIDLGTFLMATTSGVIEAVEEDRVWRLDYASMQPFDDGGDKLIVLRTPQSTSGELIARAAWGVAWVDHERWAERGRRLLWGIEPEVVQPAIPPMPEHDLIENPFRGIVGQELAGFLHQLYLDGDVELLESERRDARAEAFLLDMRTNEGWMEDAALHILLDFGGELEPMVAHADKLRMRADGSLHANGATLTGCEFERPHYWIETGSLRLDPRPGGSWRISARKNRLRFPLGLQIPLPPIGGLVLDEEGDFEGFETAEGEVFGVQSIFVSESARFGTSVGTGVQTEIGRVGEGVGRALGFDEAHLRGRWKYDASWLGSRGLLWGIGLELREKHPERTPEEEFRMNMYLSGISDDQEDRGYVRVEPDDRDSFRGWLRGRGRYPFDRDEWIDIEFSTQTDPGVQAEFFEGDFVRYEMRDNGLHYRKADGLHYYQARAKARVDDYRTVIEELPSAGVYRGAAPVAKIFGLPLHWIGSLDVGYLRRRQGDIGNQDDPDLPPEDEVPEEFTEYWERRFTDGFGDREVVRADSSQRLELPFSTGVAGIRATPYVEARMTGWDRGQEREEAPARAALFGGLELATTLWKRDEDSLASITPSLGVRGDFLSEESEAEPVAFDEVEQPITGKQLELGMRSRWRQLGGPHAFDLELRGLRRYDRGDELDDLSRAFVLSELRTEAWGLPLAFRIDGRYDFGPQDFEYGRAAVGLAPTERLLLELAYVRGPEAEDDEAILLAGEDQDPSQLEIEEGQRLFEALTAELRYRLSPKWEVEVRQTINLARSGRLGSDLVLRRFGHDFLIELSLEERSGEGVSFGFSIEPLLGWTPDRLGIL